MLFLAVAAAVLTASAAQAQPVEAAPSNQQLRYHISVMEGVLERAVDDGANNLRREVRRVMPDLLLISGAAQARGFRLEGYGVFFDVAVPVLRRSVAWTIRTMFDDSGAAAATAIRQLKAHIDANVTDPRAKANLQQALKRLEMQVGPMDVQPAAASAPPAPGTVAATTEAAPAPAPPPPDPRILEDPNQAYTDAVVNALIDAILDYSARLGVGPEEWLTVAARDNEHRDRLAAGDPYELATIMLRAKGSDLAAYRAGRLTREEARKRVEVREF